MLVTPTAAADLAREGHIAAALQALSEEPPTVASLALALECRLARGEVELALGVGEQLTTLGGLDGDDTARPRSRSASSPRPPVATRRPPPTSCSPASTPVTTPTPSSCPGAPAPPSA